MKLLMDCCRISNQFWAGAAVFAPPRVPASTPDAGSGGFAGVMGFAGVRELRVFQRWLMQEGDGMGAV